MKPFSFVLFLLVMFHVVTLTACSNTMQGFHEDWRNNMQKAADETNKATHSY